MLLTAWIKATGRVLCPHLTIGVSVMSQTRSLSTPKPLKLIINKCGWERRRGRERGDAWSWNGSWGGSSDGLTAVTERGHHTQSPQILVSANMIRANANRRAAVWSEILKVLEGTYLVLVLISKLWITSRFLMKSRWSSEGLQVCTLWPYKTERLSNCASGMCDRKLWYRFTVCHVHLANFLKA